MFLTITLCLLPDVDASDAGAKEKVRSLVLQADSRCAFMNAQEVR
jgi:hypothetical protein